MSFGALAAGMVGRRVWLTGTVVRVSGRGLRVRLDNGSELDGVRADDVDRWEDD